MAVLVAGHFRLPQGRLDDARPAMERVVRLTLKEAGCLGYSYAPDLLDPGLIRVCEKWESRAALDTHLAAPHMDEWRSVREGLGLTDRTISLYEVASETPL